MWLNICVSTAVLCSLGNLFFISATVMPISCASSTRNTCDLYDSTQTPGDKNCGTCTTRIHTRLSYLFTHGPQFTRFINDYAGGGGGRPHDPLLWFYGLENDFNCVLSNKIKIIFF
ncbi:hypothetical protein XENTR_v10016393 [Xenopus tropicalis]|nr:hypothetical protein XENTR_v10016393 [Xenopus tropicalis]